MFIESAYPISAKNKKLHLSVYAIAIFIFKGTNFIYKQLNYN